MLHPPNIDGVMAFANTEMAAIKTKLIAIRDAFTATDEQSVCDTFYIVSTYNRQNAGKEINGDTAEYILM